MAFIRRATVTMLFLNRIATASPTPNLSSIVPRNLPSYYLKYSTTTSSDPLPFTTNYLITNLKLSPEIASQVSKRVHFEKPERSDLLLASFRDYGFSNSQICTIIKKRALLLLSDFNKSILPKLEFLESKGASRPQIAHIVTSGPRFLLRSLENCVIPCYDLLKTLVESDERAIECLMRRPFLISETSIADNAQFLLDIGVPGSKIILLFSRRPLSVGINPESFKKAVEEVKELGFNPQRSDFVLALHVKIVVSESTWKRKVDLFKRWGWSEETIASAFARRPWCMVISDSKVGEIMDFFVTHMGWDSMVVAKNPKLLSFSLHKRILPRASVIQFLHSNGLIRRNVTHISAFLISEKLFLQRFIDDLKEKAPQLLKLYQEKKNVSLKMTSSSKD